LLDVNIVNLEFMNVLKGTPSRCNVYLITTTSPAFCSAAVNWKKHQLQQHSL